ncbi:fungal specific transcription factor domain-containing protein [Aspergillus affinis]|uniref:fungal specific transcription factor domain-containing protein n=1 Tax=Aspergillus affinis TaxID=1070780 RepID=UPI0022FF2873|nr:uncharacterized protein KD926_010313 [Aspergillus affinis]KAI9044990.1 hypothetical protein KD926_010313 [Aspergillus affinis]
MKKRGRRSNASKQSQRSTVGAILSSDSYGAHGDMVRHRSQSITSMGMAPLSSHLAATEDDRFRQLQLPPTEPGTAHDERTGLPNGPDSRSTFGFRQADSFSPVAFPISPSATNSNENGQQQPIPCRYPCLERILPGLKGFMSANEACDLLDTFFSGPGNSLSSTHSPYVLTTVLRKKSLLHRTKPRPTSPALLATMLWCVAQTADSRIYYVPGARERITNHLYSLAMSHLRLRDTDNWHRVAGGWQLEEDCMLSVGSYEGEKARRTFSTGPQPTVDDVLTFTLLTVVISGGVFKADCLKWWNKAVGLVKFLGYNTEPGIAGNSDISEHSSSTIEDQEERRRAFWLVYALDRHLALSFNGSLHILDAECHVLGPLPEDIWQDLDTIPLDLLPRRTYGPSTTISGPGLFEYFLPLMAILGDIIDLRLRHHHPRLPIDNSSYLDAIKQTLSHCESSLADFADNTLPGSPTNTRAQLVIAYSTYIIKVLYVLLHGEWDAISMLEDTGNWIASPSFSECASSSIAAAQCISDILSVDSELSFMPYLFGIYLFHGSFVLLLFAERMPQIGPNESVEQACEVIIRAHEVAIVTLSTDFQVSQFDVLHTKPRFETNTEDAVENLPQSLQVHSVSRQAAGLIRSRVSGSSERGAFYVSMDNGT